MTAVAASSVWYEGSQPAYDLTFVDDAGDPANPTALTVAVRQPDGTTTSYTTSDPELASVTTGQYLYVMQTPLADADEGIWALIVTPTLDGRQRVTEILFRCELVTNQL